MSLLWIREDDIDWDRVVRVAEAAEIDLRSTVQSKRMLLLLQEYKKGAEGKKYEGDKEMAETLIHIYKECGKLEDIEKELKKFYKDSWVDLWLLSVTGADYKVGLEEWFYRGMKKHYLDYYLVLGKLGYSDSEAESLVSGRLKTIYERVKEVMRVRGRSIILQKGMEEGDKGALSIFLKDSETSKEKGNVYIGSTEADTKKETASTKIDTIKIGKADDKVVYSLGAGASKPEQNWIDDL